MDDIINNPNDDAQTAAMPLSEETKAMRRVYALIRQAKLKLAEVYVHNPVHAWSYVQHDTVTLDQELNRRHELDVTLDRIEQEVSKYL